MTLAMGMDQHRAPISAEWIDTITGEISTARIAPAERGTVRRFLTRFDGGDLEVALEAMSGARETSITPVVSRAAGARAGFRMVL